MFAAIFITSGNAPCQSAMNARFVNKLTDELGQMQTGHEPNERPVAGRNTGTDLSGMWVMWGLPKLDHNLHLKRTLIQWFRTKQKVEKLKVNLSGQLLEDNYLSILLMILSQLCRSPDEHQN